MNGRHVIFLRVTLVGLLSMLKFGVALADKTDFRVNDDVGVVDQNHPRIALSGDGSFAVVWADMRGGQSDIYLQRFGPDWEPVGPNRRLNDDTAGAHQAEPALAADFTGRFSAVWTDYRDGNFPFGPREYFQRLDSALVSIGANRNLTVSAPDSLKESPDIALSTFGSGVAVWADFRNRRWDIYAQRFSADGSTVGENVIVNSVAAGGQQHSPRVSVSQQGWYVVTWYGSRLGNDDIWVQMFDSVGNAVGQNILVNSDGSGVRQAFPDVAADGEGHFTVVWIDWRNGGDNGDPDIYSRRFASDMTALTNDTRVNRDGSGRAQRQPTISADRKGNVGIIWADSAKGSWDITGQMIDVEGVIREANFQANDFADSSQVQPDVALDGRYRYVVWSDNRNGHFDIYGSVSQYNDPRLLASPASLDFVMDLAGATPAPQTLFVDHAGFNPLSFQAVSSASWLGVSPSTGTTPESLSVGIAPLNLGLGSYEAVLTLIDASNGDSSVAVPVRLTVSTPTMDVQPDSLVFRAFAGLDMDIRQSVAVVNSGTGKFDWTATGTAPWLSLRPSSGASDSHLDVIVNSAMVIAGDHYDTVVVSSPDAAGAPDSVFVAMRAVDDLPYLVVAPDSLSFVTNQPENVSSRITVSNGGVGRISWQATVGHPWLVIDKASGEEGDVINVNLDKALLPAGEYLSSIRVFDSSAFNIERVIPVYANVLQASADTIRFGSARVPLLGSDSIGFSLDLSQSLSFLVVPIMLDSSVIVLDSITMGSNLPSYVNLTLVNGRTPGEYTISMNTTPVDTSLPSGLYDLGMIHFTAGQVDTAISVEAVMLDTLRPNLGPGSGAAVTPVILPGEIVIGTPTDVHDDYGHVLPPGYSLAQNYPNPFNPLTTISFDLPVRTSIRLEVFNLLGQRVSLLASGLHSAGEHVFVWNGSRSASGVYFYRLRAEDTTGISLVRKMVLLK